MGTNFPLLSRTERDRRWNLIRGEMSKLGLDCLVIAGDQSNWGGNFANVRYVTGIGDIGFALFPLREEPVLFNWWMAPLEARQSPEVSPLTRTILDKAGRRKPVRSPWAIAEPWVNHIRQLGPRWGESVARCIKDLGLQQGTIGMVGTSQNWEPDGVFPWKTYQVLRKELPQANFVDDATFILERARLCKSPEEIRCVEKASEIADAGIEAMVETARPGVSEIKVYARIHERMMEEGSERYIIVYWTSGPTPTHVQLSTPPDRPLEKGDFIISEITPRYGGYVAHPHQPVSIGKPIKEYEEMFNLLRRTRDAAFAKLKPGVTIGEQEDALTRPLEAAGYSYLHCPFHGMGLSGLEFPNANFWGKTNPIEASPRDMVFEEGMVLAYEPMISTSDRKIGIPLGDTVVITATGARRLSKYCNELIVV